MAQLTVDKLEKRRKTKIVLKRMSEEEGEPVEITVRSVRSAEWMATIPLPPSGVDTGTPEERIAKEREWLRSAPDGEHWAYREAGTETFARLIKTALLDPVLTVEQIKMWGDDLDEAVVELLRFSKILPPKTEEQVPEPEPTPEPKAESPDGVVVRGRLG